VALLAPDDRTAVRKAYLTVLTREPTAEEAAHFEERLQGSKGNQRSQRMEDLCWVLLNATEFSWNYCRINVATWGPSGLPDWFDEDLFMPGEEVCPLHGAELEYTCGPLQVSRCPDPRCSPLILARALHHYALAGILERLQGVRWAPLGRDSIIEALCPQCDGPLLLGVGHQGDNYEIDTV